MKKGTIVKNATKGRGRNPRPFLFLSRYRAVVIRGQRPWNIPPSSFRSRQIRSLPGIAGAALVQYSCPH